MEGPIRFHATDDYGRPANSVGSPEPTQWRIIYGDTYAIVPFTQLARGTPLQLFQNALNSIESVRQARGLC